MRFGPCVAIAFLAFSCVAAKADSYPVGGTGSSMFTGSATLTTTLPDSNNVYTITDIAPGTGYGAGINTLLPAGFNNGGHINDNLLYPDSSTALVDTKGFGFTATEGDTDFDVDVYSTGNSDYAAYLLDSDGFSETIPVTIDLTVVQADPVFSIAFKGVPAASATPEPSSLALLGTGFLGLAGLVRRRRRC